MKTVRFAQIVEQCGKPEIHLLLVEPAKDAKFQKAIKAKRVMTVFQSTDGQKTDHAEVAFEAGTKRQFLIFPKSLAQHAGSRIVGIRYELMESSSVAKRPRAEKAHRPIARAHRKRRPSQDGQAQPADKVVPFPNHHRAEPDEEDEESDAIAEIKAHVRHAMEHLERGKQVAAFNLLKRIVDG